MTYPAVYGAVYSAPAAPQPPAGPGGQSVLARLSWLGIAREMAPGMPALPAAAVPVDPSGYEPEDTPGFLLDLGVRATMGAVAGAVPGTLGATHSLTGPLYADTAGWWLDNLLGDLSTVPNAAGGVPGSPLAVASNTGDLTLSLLTPISPVTAGTVIAISDGAASEVLIASAGSTGTVIQCPSTPPRFPHATTATVSAVTAATGYTHTFAALNSGSGQPPTHTLTDTTGLTAGTGARAYPGVCVTRIDLAGDPGAGWVTAKVSALGWLSQPSAATTAYPPGAYVAPFAGWQSVVTVAGGLAYAGKWAVSLARPTVTYRSAGNPQTPFVIARGGLVATGALAYPDPSDETPLSQMTSGAQPPVQVALSNGLTGTQALSMTLACPQAQFTKAAADRAAIALGYGTTWQAIDSAAGAGGSGGTSPVQVTLVNGTATY